MPSYTYAVKADKLLKSRGYNSRIERNKKKCGFSLKTDGDYQEITGIFEKYSIPYENISCGGEPL